MSPVQPGFIGRSEQIRIFEDVLLYEGERRWILNIYGSGGIGKTALVRYYQALCEQYGAPYGPLIDFYELAYHSPRRVMRDIARGLREVGRGPDYFAPFLEATAREPGLHSAEVAEKYLREAVRLFRAGLVQLAQDAMTAHRIKTVLFFDTCEQAPDSLRAWLLQELLCDLPHVVAIVAGRDALPPPPGREQEFYPCVLDTFTLEEARSLFLASRLPAPVDERHIADLWSLARGVPILLALAADWLSHGVNPEELSRISSDQFARSLVQRFANLGELTNAAVLYMGHLFHRFNADIFCKVHPADNGLDLSAAHRVLEDLRSFQFVKHRPSGNYQLQDHARRLVCDYLLTGDEGLALRLRLSRAVLANYYKLIEQKRTPPDPVLQAEQLYHELFIDAHYPKYAEMFPDDIRDAQHGYRLFEEMFDAAINRNDRVEICDLLLSVVEHEDLERIFADRPGTLIKRARLWLRDPNRREEAYQLLAEVMNKPTTSTLHRVEALLSLGRFAPPDAAKVYQQQARQEIQNLIETPSAQRPLPPSAALPDFEEPAAEEAPPVKRTHALQLLAYLETNLGLTCRRQGRWGEAIEHYQRTLEALAGVPNTLQKRRQMAAAYNNLAFIYRQRGDLYKAEIFCRLSLAAREEMGETGQVAYSYHTLGEIYMDMGQHAQARRYLLKSLAAFRQVGDMRNAGMVFVDLATLARWRGAPDLADYYYNQAVNLFEAWEVPEGIIDATNERACELHRRGAEQAEIEDQASALEHYRQAEGLLRESLQTLDGSDRHYRLAYTRAKLALILHAQARLTDDPAEKGKLIGEILALADQMESYASAFNYVLFASDADILRGQIAFERIIEQRRSAAQAAALPDQAAQDVEIAFKYFARGCAALAEFYQSPSDKFRRAFERTIDCLLHPALSPAEVSAACSTLILHFEREGKDHVAAAFLENCRRIRQARGLGSERDGLA